MELEGSLPYSEEIANVLCLKPVIYLNWSKFTANNLEYFKLQSKNTFSECLRLVVKKLNQNMSSEKGLKYSVTSTQIIMK